MRLSKEKLWIALVLTAVIAFWLGRGGLPEIIAPGDSNFSGEEITTDDGSGIEIIDNRKQNGEKITVHMAGEVKYPGVYRLEEGARIVDGIIAAGGEKDTADLDAINLASELDNSEQIYIPPCRHVSAETGESSVSEWDGKPSVSGAIDSGLININSAGPDRLSSLTGIGPVRAKAIVSHRESEGPFTAVEDIMNVTGIGEATFDGIHDQISVQ